MGMHVPWIQVTQEAWDLANQFAGLTGLTFQEAFTGLIEAWRWGVGLGPETEPPKGVCDSPRALDRLASVMRLLKLDRQALADVLVELEVIELRPVGLRVRGTRRYWPAWAKNNPDPWRAWKSSHPEEFPGSEPEPEKPRTEPGRNRTESEPKPDENRPVSAPQTQTQTQTQEKQLPLTHPPTAQKVAERPPGTADDLREAFSSEFERATGNPYRVTDSYSDSQALIALLAIPEATPDEVRRRSLAALADEWFRKRASLPLLVKQWNQHRGHDAPPPDDRPPCSGCDQRKETAVFNGRRLCYGCAAEVQRASA